MYLCACSPWCGKSDDFCGFSLIFAEPGLEKEVGKSKIIVFGLISGSEQHNSILKTVFSFLNWILEMSANPERFLVPNGKWVS